MIKTESILAPLLFLIYIHIYIHIYIYIYINDLPNNFLSNVKLFAGYTSDTTLIFSLRKSIMT